MATSHDPAAHPHGEHHGPSLRIYLTVFVALCVFTALSFIVNVAEHTMGFGAIIGMFIILLVAVCKATLVTMYFMHLKYDWSKVFFIMVPVVILAVMMMIVLMPDTVVGWHDPAYHEIAE